MLAIVVSRADSASEHVGEHLLDLREWDRRRDDGRPDAEGGGTYYRHDAGAARVELRTFEDLHLELDGVAAAFGHSATPEDRSSSDREGEGPDLLVFASRHSGETGPLLTAHVTGNFGPAEYGGTDGDLAAAAPNAVARIREAFATHAPEDYDVGLECTHHGPSSVGCPSLFAEVGSAAPQWRDPEAARAVARSILDLAGVAPHRERQFVGFGGGHYVPRFERIVRETPWAVGHVGADWCLDAMGDPDAHREVIARAFERSRAAHAVIDGEYPALEAVVADLGYRVVGETWLRAVGDRPLALVAAVEDALGRIDDGVRFGERVPVDPGTVGTDGGPRPDPDAVAAAARTFDVCELPDALLTEALGVDAAAARSAAEHHAVAFGTVEGATKPAGRVALPAGGAGSERDAADAGGSAAAAYDALVDALAAVLRSKYDTVTRQDDAVIAERTAFDPGLARAAGVPEGPAFGALADGQSVTVDGERIDPAEVRSAETERFPVGAGPSSE